MFGLCTRLSLLLTTCSIVNFGRSFSEMGLARLNDHLASHMAGAAPLPHSGSRGVVG